MKTSFELLDFEIDKLTNSIENTLTGEVFDTEIFQITSKEKRLVKKSEWLFDWHLESSNTQKQALN